MSGLVRKLIEQGDALVVSASPLNETYYVLHSSLGYTASQAREALRDIASVFEVADVTEDLIHAALNSDESDYEDAVVRAVAEANECDAIVSSDKRAFKRSYVPRLEADKAKNRENNGLISELG